MSSVMTEATSTMAADWGYKIRLVRLSDLIVDDRYQRPLNEVWIRQRMEVFDPYLVGTLDVSERKDGTLAIMDGQQRAELLRNVGYLDVHAALYPRMSLEDEAAFFVRKNRDRKNMTPFYTYRAKLVAGDPITIEVNDTVTTAGFTISGQTNDKDAIGAVRAVEKTYVMQTDHWDEVLTPTLSVIQGSVYGRRHSLDGDVIQGLGRFHQAFARDEFDNTKLMEIVSNVGPTTLIGRASDLTHTGRASNRAGNVARVLVTEYNNNRNGNPRLDAKKVKSGTWTR